MGEKMAGKRSTFPQAIREELSCSICKELYTVPKVLPCQHTFCQDCLQKASQAGELFTCLTCDTEVDLTPERIKDLPDDRAVLAVCDRIRNQAKVLPQVKQEPDNNRDGNEDDSEKSQAEHEKSQAETFCETHSTENLGLYCIQCKLPVCTVCLDESHPGHRMVTFKKAIQDRKTAATTYVTRGEKLLEKQCDLIKGLRTAEATLQQQKLQISSSVCDAYRKMLSKLEEMKEEMLTEVREKHRQNMTAVVRARDPVLAQVAQLVITCGHVEEELKKQRAEFSLEENQLIQAVGSGTEGLSLQEPELVSLDAEVAHLLQYNSVYQCLTLTPGS
ncbi:TRIM55 [Branchiostoma lanceolatum]|uniref:TRIM55 protein n=1 Tax=Branchiostoma lanceolatum TaxID=7740 RepID=A0A8J9ZD41_BRALA|nr:TRIM55 [Branchiostoma lanceolatum]